jgi:hypothetical protein
LYLTVAPGSLGRHMERHASESSDTPSKIGPDEIRQRRRLLRVAIPIVSVLAIVRGVSYLLDGTLWLDGVFLVVIGLVLGAWSRWWQPGTVEVAPTPRSVEVHAFVFAGGCVAVGIALLLLAAFGATTLDVFWGALGLLIATCGVYVGARQVRSLRRAGENEEHLNVE